jgi:ketosteroid isomerase-like protein
MHRPFSGGAGRTVPLHDGDFSHCGAMMKSTAHDLRQVLPPFPSVRWPPWPMRHGDNGVVTRRPLPPVAAVVSFIDRVNHGDVPGLADLMTDDHRLVVLDEPAVIGRQANIAAWEGYAAAFPDYVIYPHEIVERDGQVAVAGHTTGSHLGLPDGQEARLTIIWLADVRAGRLASWHIVEDTPAVRAQFGLTPRPKPSEPADG